MITFLQLRAHIGRSTGRSTPQVQTSSVQEWQYEISPVRVHIGRSTGISSPRLASGEEWQFHISTVRAHIRQIQLADLLPSTDS